MCQHPSQRNPHPTRNYIHLSIIVLRRDNIAKIIEIVVDTQIQLLQYREVITLPMATKIICNKNHLHKNTEPVATLQEGEEIAQKLLAALGEFPRGLGLSANQIGVQKRVSVVKIPDSDPLILINPEIVAYGPETIIYREGCLSIPGKIVWTKRTLNVKISTMNHANVLEFGPDTMPPTKESVANDYGLLRSVCIQHEIDHLNGRLITDDDVRVIPPASQSVVKYGRNDKVVIEKDGITKFVKYKIALDLITNDGWKLI